MRASPLAKTYEDYSVRCAEAADPDASTETLMRLANHPLFSRYEGSLLERLLLRHPNLPHGVMNTFYGWSRWPLLLNPGFLLFVLVEGKADADERLREMAAEVAAQRLSVRWSEAVERRFVGLVGEAMRQHVRAGGNAKAFDRDTLVGGDDAAWRTRYARGWSSGPDSLANALRSAFRMPTQGHVHPGLLLTLSAADLVADAPVTFVVTSPEEREIDDATNDIDHLQALATIDSWFDSPRLPSLRSTVPASDASTTPPSSDGVPTEKTPPP